MVERDRWETREGALERRGLAGPSSGTDFVPVFGDITDLGRGTAVGGFQKRRQVGRTDIKSTYDGYLIGFVPGARQRPHITER
jgi:hypothetical protein